MCWCLRQKPENPSDRIWIAVSAPPSTHPPANVTANGGEGTFTGRTLLVIFRPSTSDFHPSNAQATYPSTADPYNLYLINTALYMISPSRFDMAPSTNGNNAHATTNGTSDESHVQSFWARYEHLKLNDVLKNVLLEVRLPLTS